MTTLVLERLRQRQRSYDEEPHENLDFAKYSANLEHLLLCLQQAALAALIHLSLKLIEAEALRWINFRRRLVQVIEGWFAEWPGGRHPLSTTWPWTIKSSLVILWGVCWKFHTGDNAQMWMPNGTAQSGQFSENSRPWSALPAQSAVPSQQSKTHDMRVQPVDILTNYCSCQIQQLGQRRGLILLQYQSIRHRSGSGRQLATRVFPDALIIVSHLFTRGHKISPHVLFSPCSHLTFHYLAFAFPAFRFFTL